MNTLQGKVAKIIKELKQIQTVPSGQVESFPIPTMIGTGDGKGIVTSPELERLIVLVARQIQDDDPVLSKSFTADEWASAVRSAFGPALITFDHDDDPLKNASAVITHVQETLRKNIARNGKREHAIGCTLLSTKTSMEAFAIGPVRFEPRITWLARKVAEGDVSLTMQRRLARKWSSDAKLRKRKVSRESFHEEEILGIVGNCPYICSVQTEGLALEAGREKALLAARLALTAIALLWQNPSRTLSGLNLSYDRSLLTQKIVIFAPGNQVLSASKLSHMPHGPYLKTGGWERIVNDNEDYFAIVGEILTYVLSPTGGSSRPRIMNTLAQALLWFHEGCRETVALMAVVKFTASLDALACGKKSDGIRKLINSRLGIKDDAPIRENGPTLKDAITRIYREGRSRAIHGTNDKFGYDWSPTRALAEQFARLCLVNCLDWAINNPSADDPSLLVKGHSTNPVSG